MEQVLNATRVYLPSASTRAQLEQLGWHLIANYIVRNADCHSKNIALFYTQRGDVAFTPAFDIVTMQAYPRYAQNPPRLSIGGRTAPSTDSANRAARWRAAGSTTRWRTGAGCRLPTGGP